MKESPIKPLFPSSNYLNALTDRTIQLKADCYHRGKVLFTAKSDVEAILAFMKEYKHNNLTLRSYTREIEKFLLWCIHKSKISIKNIKRVDLLDYKDFGCVIVILQV